MAFDWDQEREDMLEFETHQHKHDDRYFPECFHCVERAAAEWEREKEDNT